MHLCTDGKYSRYLYALSVIGTLVYTLLVCKCTAFLAKGDKDQAPAHSAYYWSTVFDLDSTQTAFISRQHINKLYLRYFDVVMTNGQPMPNATVQFQTAKPDSMEIVPTVFIMNDCMGKAQPELDSLLLGRILQMSETHDMGPIHEVQLDCDWTKATRGNYFDLLQRLRKRAKTHGIEVSSTIRLHQLSQAPPPVDRGVLMMYNTGDVTRFNGTDPILDMRDVKPYLPYLQDYNLPLATAYPVFSWKVVFRKVTMESRLTRERENEGAKERRGEATWKYIGILHSDEYLPILPGDTIVERQPTPDMVRRARQAIDSLRPDANREIIIYDISKQNIQRIKTYHYEKILCSHPAGTGTQP